MNNLHMPSVLKAGGMAAVVAILLGVLSYVPVLGPVIGFCFLCGGFLIPVGAGLAYGYFAPGQEDMTQSAMGGALAGGVSGILLGLFSAISGAALSGIQQGAGEAIAAGATGGLICGTGFCLAGFVLGAIGGAIWPMVQKQKA